MGALRVSGHSSPRTLLATVLVAALAVGFGFSPVGAASVAQTDRVNVSSTGTEANQRSYWPSISANGRFVTYQSSASNLVAADTNRYLDVFVYDRNTDKTRRVSVSSNGTQTNHGSFLPSISAHGRFVTYTSNASNLVAADTNRDWDVFVYDRGTHKTRRVSVSSTGTQANGRSEYSTISANGRFVTYASIASNLVATDTNRMQDVFVYDRATHKTRRVSVSSTGTQTNDSSSWPSISADGRFVAFYSYASNLVRADTNDRPDVFIRGPLR